MVTIVGAGICGAATAYYLASAAKNNMNNIHIHIIDAVGPAGGGASGKAGAYLSETTFWGDGTTKTEPLHRKSFQLHVDLAKELELESFQFVPTFRINNDWDEIIQLMENNDNDNDDHCQSIHNGRAATVDPAELTQALVNKAVERGASLQIAELESISVDEHRHDNSNNNSSNAPITLHFTDGSTHVVDDELILALGPWTCRVEDWLRIPLPLEGVVSPHLIYQDIPLNPMAIFWNEPDEHGCQLELLSRYDDSVYVSGTGFSKSISPTTLRGPSRPTPGHFDVFDVNDLPSTQKSLQKCSFLDGTTPPIIRSCMRPVTPDAMPIVGRLHHHHNNNIYVATGGGVWGITWGPLMGNIMASIITDSSDCPVGGGVTMKHLSPKRFDSFLYRSLMKQREKEAWK